MSQAEQEAYVAESLNRALDEMEAHKKNGTKPMSFDDFMSPYYLSLVTRNVAGLSPKKMIDNFVLLEIKTMLDARDLTVKELAEIFHFNDPSYMCRYFKKQTGMSLSQYREAIRTKGIKTFDKK